MRLLAKQPIVVGMTANPEPDVSVWRFDGQGAIVGADPGRPESADLPEAKRWMSRILLQACVRLIGELPDLGRQRLIQRPEIGRRVMSQSGVVLPAA